MSVYGMDLWQQVLEFLCPAIKGREAATGATTFRPLEVESAALQSDPTVLRGAKEHGGCRNDMLLFGLLFFSITNQENTLFGFSTHNREHLIFYYWCYE